MKQLRMELLRDHAAIELLSKRLSRLTEAGASAAELAHALKQLVDTVAAHLAIEEAALYSEAMQSLPGFTPEAIARATNEFEKLKTNWTSYCDLWTAEDIASNKPGFIAATKAILQRLGDRVRLETDLLVMAGALDNSRHA
ncbi:hemerythrin domain-containing protein [Sphingomonas sp. MMS12-HWE2-04]|uniref:hemerythrin domain-containing protein n=1 Tax=Sphingomonas sp. MMS12-HWE2-04 TaxID=3234199 RepID=UPI00384E7F95